MKTCLATLVGGAPCPYPIANYGGCAMHDETGRAPVVLPPSVLTPAPKWRDGGGPPRIYRHNFAPPWEWRTESTTKPRVRKVVSCYCWAPGCTKRECVVKWTVRA